MTKLFKTAENQYVTRTENLGILMIETKHSAYCGDSICITMGEQVRGISREAFENEIREIVAELGFDMESEAVCTTVNINLGTVKENRAMTEEQRKAREADLRKMLGKFRRVGVGLYNVKVNPNLDVYREYIYNL